MYVVTINTDYKIVFIVLSPGDFFALSDGPFLLFFVFVIIYMYINYIANITILSLCLLLTYGNKLWIA